jgi:hypothetical protein
MRLLSHSRETVHLGRPTRCNPRVKGPGAAGARTRGNRTATDRTDRLSLAGLRLEDGVPVW